MDHHDLAVHVATQFRRYREKAGMTQAGVAVKAGTTVETVARLERAPRGRASANANPTLETLARLSYAVGIEPLALLREGGLKIPTNDRLDKALLRATQPIRNTLAVLAEALIADEGMSWGVHSDAPAHVARAKPAKKKPSRR